MVQHWSYAFLLIAALRAIPTVNFDKADVDSDSGDVIVPTDLDIPELVCDFFGTLECCVSQFTTTFSCLHILASCAATVPVCVDSAIDVQQVDHYDNHSRLVSYYFYECLAQSYPTYEVRKEKCLDPLVKGDSINRDGLIPANKQFISAMGLSGGGSFSVTLRSALALLGPRRYKSRPVVDFTLPVADLVKSRSGYIVGDGLEVVSIGDDVMITVCIEPAFVAPGAMIPDLVLLKDSLIITGGVRMIASPSMVGYICGQMTSTGIIYPAYLFKAKGVDPVEDDDEDWPTIVIVVAAVVGVIIVVVVVFVAVEIFIRRRARAPEPDIDETHVLGGVKKVDDIDNQS